MINYDEKNILGIQYLYSQDMELLRHQVLVSKLLLSGY